MTNGAGFVTAAGAASAAPVQSVNGQTGTVTLSIPTDTGDLTNGAGFVTAAGAASAAPVQSVNGQTGAVSLSFSSVMVLWTNPSPTSAFLAQTINLADNTCNLFIVLAVHQTNDQTQFTPAFVVPGMASCLQQIQGKQNGYDGEISALIRRITATTQTSLTFALCNVIDKNGNAYTGRGDLAVPYMVIGIKF